MTASLFIMNLVFAFKTLLNFVSRLKIDRTNDGCTVLENVVSCVHCVSFVFLPISPCMCGQDKVCVSVLLLFCFNLLLILL